MAKQLRNIAFKKQLAAEEVAALEALGEPINVAQGKVHYDEGEPCQYAYTLEEGIVMLERLSSDGRRQVLAFVYPGDFIGIDVSGVHLVTATTLRPARLIRYKLDALDALSSTYPAIDRALKQVTSRILAYTLDHLCVLGRMNARQRLLYFFFHLHERQGIQSDQPIDVPMSRQDVADFLGLTVETVSRTMSKLKADQLLSSPASQRVRILDRARALDELDLPFHLNAE